MKQTSVHPLSHFTVTKKTVLSGLLVAIGIILPMVTHLSGLPGGPVLLPMHLPVFLAGMLLGAPFGALVGLVLPALSTVLTGMPKIFPAMPLMTLELAVYGFVAGYLNQKRPERILWSLIGAMIAGRIAYAVSLLIAGKILMLNVPSPAFVITAVITGLPGIAVQIAVVPTLIKIVKKHYSCANQQDN